MLPTRQRGALAPGLAICPADAPVPDELRGAVVAIGNFDGLHLGHQRLVAVADEEARARGTASAILTFDPHPRAFFRPDAPVFRLTPWPIKLRLLDRLRVDAVFVRRFDRALADTSAEAFVAELLVGWLGCAGVVVGEDFHFGRGREGTPDVLRQLADRHGIGSVLVPPVMQDDVAVSSSRVRDALAAGDIATANRLLGYRWIVEGEVVHGHKRGRELGFPTANVALDPGCRLAHGIYAVRAALGGGEIVPGVASFGSRPTFDDGPPLLEVHLFDFAADLYGRTIDVEFLSWIRGEERFDSADQLVARMRVDAAEARSAIGRSTDLLSIIV